MIYDHRRTKQMLEGEIDQNKCVGTEPLPIRLGEHHQVDVSDPTVLAERYKTVLAENQFLRNVLYHEATFLQQRQYRRFQQISNQSSTSNIASAIQDMSRYHLTPRSGGVTKVSNTLSTQFLYRWVYQIVEEVAGGIDWDHKPKGLSKLKWLWRINYAPIVKIVLSVLGTVIRELEHADKTNFNKVLLSLNKKVSKRAAERKP